MAVFSSCDDFDASLDTPYTANPTPEEVASEATALSAFQSWFSAVNSYDGPALMLTTMADMRTCSHGNQGMNDMSGEPRKAWDNNPGYSNASASEDYYTALYTLLANQSTVIKNINEGTLATEDPAKTESLARFGQAVAIGYIALVYDRVWIVDETGPLFDSEATSPALAMDVALEKLDRAIELADNNTFTVDAINGLSLTSEEWSEFLNSMGARLLANTPRNSTQRDALDWDKVLNYANNGITYDVEILWDGAVNWWSEWLYYANVSGWARVDMRVVNLLDPSSPARWPASASILDPATSNDSRLDTDFEYLDSQGFRPDRGTYHYSNYRHSRYDEEIFVSEQTAAVPEMLIAENDLYKAEAILRSGGAIADAVTIINASSRVLRGELTPLSETASFDEVVDAIHYERSIELLTSGMGIGFFEMRKNDLLQIGTPLHLPVPGAYLLAGGYENYTIGGVSNADGIDVSNGGW
ncbi:hypothetical protein APS56_13910 [Pseudalgibacter alginicilyticus]|uniref:Uncharacterized protein n=1 Tax=Pseudalgibacter alginicilyticus TaxID=1736674 RepID=A0A0P0CTH2_9FLAO|nr:hypothetical protein APS56_13910 [Pseudalgibacter alginicilyticus]